MYKINVQSLYRKIASSELNAELKLESLNHSQIDSKMTERMNCNTSSYNFCNRYIKSMSPTRLRGIEETKKIQNSSRNWFIEYCKAFKSNVKAFVIKLRFETIWL